LDAATNTVYFFSKGYKNGASSGGVANGSQPIIFVWAHLTMSPGIYHFYAVDVLTLQDKPGFPVLVDGSFADNDNSR
jgi:iron transport multicopper oxidase